MIIYRRAEDLVENPPAGDVALFILAGADQPATTAQTLQWLKQHWPHCPIVVVDDDVEHEMAARSGGAVYLTRPVSAQEWSAVLSQARLNARPRDAQQIRTGR